jgi:hypothetical protein
VFHSHCEELSRIINQNQYCLECNKEFKEYVFIKSIIDSYLNGLTNKNYVKYIKYIKNNDESKITKITESSKKVNKTTTMIWIY